MRDSFRQTKKQNAENDVNGEKLNAFDPVGFAVAADLKQDVNRSDYGEDFRPRKLEVHRLTKQIGDEYQQRRDKERDLQARSNRNPNAQIHFVFQRHENGGRVLGGVADNRDDDDADESLGDAERRAYALDRADQKFRKQCHESSGNEQDHDRLAARPILASFLQFALGALKEMPVRLERETEHAEVGDKKH